MLFCSAICATLQSTRSLHDVCGLTPGLLWRAFRARGRMVWASLCPHNRYCRRCISCPGVPLRCELCPNLGGAFKEVQHTLVSHSKVKPVAGRSPRWVHVVCAQWVPGIAFANDSTMEPVIGLDEMPQSRRNLTCYLCKKRAKGACIQVSHAS
jgi:hypothetical protein